MADPVADFYHNKTLTVVTGGASGAVYDLNARIIGQHLAAHIPGHPTAVVEDMPGASHTRSVDYLYNVAPRDGLTLLVAQPYIVLNKMLTPTARYEPANFSWIGRVAPVVQLGVVRTDAGVATVADLTKKKTIFGAAGSTGPSAMVPWILNRTIGTQISVVRGYENEAAYFLAMMKGEVQGLGSFDISDLERNPDLTKQKKIQILYVIGLDRYPKLPDIPAVVEFEKGGNDWSPLRLLASVPTLGLNVMAPPGLPADRLAALRQAFDEMVRDPAFIADAQKLNIEVEAMSGQKLQDLVKSVFAAPQRAIDDLRQFSTPPS
jgi:tripartite-type tricarboxylate transporter receptor subunit TctC